MQIPTDPSLRRQMVYEDIVPALDLRPFIEGEFVNSAMSTIIPVIDPMTGTVIARIPSACADDVSDAVGVAQLTFEMGTWGNLHPRERAKYLYRLADLIERDLFQLALLEATDTGKPYSGVLAWDVPHAALVYRYYAGLADKIAGMVLPSMLGTEMLTRREPVGVCAAIIPWNFPFPCLAWKIAPALAVGCTVVVKSAEHAPLSAQYLARLVQEAGFPQGVVNILCGIGAEAGMHLVKDSRIDHITFTGSASTAQEIIRTSLHHMPRWTLELGDKTPNVICADADLDVAIPAGVAAIFNVSGQSCCAASRTLVHHSIFEQVVERMAEHARKRRLGDPLDDATEQGPQMNCAQVAHIDRLVQEAIAQGGSLVTGGSISGEYGQFYAPTLLTGLPNGKRINWQEIFGPVGTIMPFTDLDEAVAIADNRDGGLAAAIWTGSQQTAEYFARKVRAGTCWVNGYGYFDPVAPWGGRKLSGWGRELGIVGIEPYLETKTIVRVL